MGKENVLIITDAFTKFSLAVCTPNQTAKTVAKVLVEKWFHVYGVLSRIHSNQGRCFDSNDSQSFMQDVWCRAIIYVSIQPSRECFLQVL